MLISVEKRSGNLSCDMSSKGSVDEDMNDKFSSVGCVLATGGLSVSETG